MAKSMTVGKRENEKKRLAKREEKLKKKESKKLSGKANSFEDMIAYVDENGMITSTPPTEDIKKEEINPDEIIIATPKKEEEEPAILRGRVEFFNEARGFGFIKDLNGVEKYFFHVNNVVGNIVENNIVTFDLERGTKGMNAVNICLEKQESVIKVLFCNSYKADMKIRSLGNTSFDLIFETFNRTFAAYDTREQEQCENI